MRCSLNTIVTIVTIAYDRTKQIIGWLVCLSVTEIPTSIQIISWISMKIQEFESF